MDIGDRMKGYEKAYNIVMPVRLPVIIRLDGKAFHTLTRGCNKPFDDNVINAMNEASKAILKGVQGVKFIYTQSDEINVLVRNDMSLEYSAWFNNEIQKIVSITAAIASVAFSKAYGKDAVFDSRAFIIPESEVTNYFIWRQNDWTRNSVQMVARSLYGPAELHKKKNQELQEMIFLKGQNWNDLPTYLKRGRGFFWKTILIGENIYRSRMEQDDELPIFTEDKSYVQDKTGYFRVDG